VNAGLWFLIRRQWQGQLRSLLRRLRGVKGVATALLTLGVLGLLVWARMRAPTGTYESWAAGLDPDSVRRYGPPTALVLVVLGAVTGRGLYFRPAEVDLLFQAPLSRLDLLLYKVVSRAGTSVISALWLALFVLLRSGSFVSALLGYFLLLVFLQVSGQLIAVVREWLAARVQGVAHALAVLALVGLPLLWVGIELRHTLGGGMDALGAALGGSRPVQGLFAVTRPFFETLVATDPVAGALWATASLCVLAALVAATALFDVAYQEAALTRSRRVQQALARIRSGGGAFAQGRRVRGIPIPRLPRLGGVGPLARRQLLELFRNLRGVATMLTLVGITVTVAIVAPLLAGGDAVDGMDRGKAARTGIFTLLMASLLLTQNFAFDFRRDLDRMGVLKALPLRRSAVAAGQLLPAALFTALLQGVGIGLIALATGALGPLLFASFALVLLPFNWLAAALDNLVFLLLPYRLVTEDPGDLPFLGRLMVVMTLKLVSLSLLIAAATGVGRLAYAASGSLLPAAGAVAGTLALLCIPATGIVAWAFGRFDVARDVPA